MTTNPGTEPTPQAGSGSDPQSQADNSGGQAPSGTQTPTLDELQRQIADLRKENASHRKKANDQQAAAQAAEQARLAEQGEFKKLAEQHETRVKELEPISERYSTLATQINATIEAETKDWPAEIKSLVPGIDIPVEQRLAQMDRLRPLLAKLQEQARGTQRGNSPNPTPTGQAGNKADAIKNNRASFVRQRNYGI